MNTQPGIQSAMPWAEGPVPLQPIENAAPPLPAFPPDLPDLDAMLPQAQATDLPAPDLGIREGIKHPFAMHRGLREALAELVLQSRRYLNATDTARRTELEDETRTDLLAALFDAERLLGE